MNKKDRYFDGMTADPKFRRLAKLLYKQKPAPEILSLSEEPRIGDYHRDYDAFTEYGFLPEKCNAWSDDAIDEYVDDLRERVTSPYDCSGQRFTHWITWHRNPNGRISVVHRLGIDV